jgi:hypothetical protein
MFGNFKAYFQKIECVVVTFSNPAISVLDKRMCELAVLLVGRVNALRCALYAGNGSRCKQSFQTCGDLGLAAERTFSLGNSALYICSCVKAVFLVP